MLILMILAAGLSSSLTIFCIFYHFWSKRQFRALDAEVQRLRAAGIDVDMTMLFDNAAKDRRS